MGANGPRVCVERVEEITSYPDIRGTLFEMLDGLGEEIELVPGGRVVVKLNLCLLKGAETGATVEPMVARALVDWLLERKDPAKIFLAEADATHLGADMAFRILGWHEVFEDYDRVELLNLSRDATVRVEGNGLEGLPMPKTLMEADYLVSLAKLKTHTQQKVTGILKNQFGAIAEKYKIRYHPRLTETICDAAAARIPDLCLIDGLIGMEGNGPTNGTPRHAKLLVVGNDPVATDHFCARLMGFRPESVPHLVLAAQRGLGRTEYDVVGNPPEPLNLRFKFLPKWKEVVKKGIGLLQRGGVNEEA